MPPYSFYCYILMWSMLVIPLSHKHAFHHGCEIKKVWRRFWISQIWKNSILKKFEWIWTKEEKFSAVGSSRTGRVRGRTAKSTESSKLSGGLAVRPRHPAVGPQGHSTVGQFFPSALSIGWSEVNQRGRRRGRSDEKTKKTTWS